MLFSQNRDMDGIWQTFVDVRTTRGNRMSWPVRVVKVSSAPVALAELQTLTCTKLLEKLTLIELSAVFQVLREVVC